MSKVEIVSAEGKTVIKVDGKEVEDCFDFMLEHSYDSFPLLSLDILAHEYTIRADGVKVEEYLCCVDCRERQEREALDYLRSRDDKTKA